MTKGVPQFNPLLAVLCRICELLESYFDDRRTELLEMKLAAQRDVWLDSATVQLMLRRSERTLFDYVRKGKLVSEKRGMANVYLESSVLKLMNP